MRARPHGQAQAPVPLQKAVRVQVLEGGIRTPRPEAVRRSVSGATVEEGMDAPDRSTSRCRNTTARAGRIRPWEEGTLGFDKTAKPRSAKSKGPVHGRLSGEAGWQRRA